MELICAILTYPNTAHNIYPFPRNSHGGQNRSTSEKAFQKLSKQWTTTLVKHSPTDRSTNRSTVPISHRSMLIELTSLRLCVGGFVRFVTGYNYRTPRKGPITMQTPKSMSWKSLRLLTFVDPWTVVDRVSERRREIFILSSRAAFLILHPPKLKPPSKTPRA